MNAVGQFSVLSKDFGLRREACGDVRFVFQVRDLGSGGERAE